MKTKKVLWRSALLALLVSVTGCETPESHESGSDVPLNADYGKPLMGEVEVSSKDDSVKGAGGLPVSVDDSPMAVWEVYNEWEDTETAFARQPGLAWGANSGLDWDEKYALWVESLDLITSSSGSQTFLLSTPYGRALEAPYLECAETAIFLRATFAAWHNLPFFMSAWTAEGTVYFGHFGIRYENDRYQNMPNFREKYADYTGRSLEEVANAWPTDPSLAKRYLTSKKDDTNFFLGEGAYTGAYLDQIFLNKRAGHFMMYLLTYIGSIHLASSSNTYNLDAPAIREGDVLLHRWQKKGVGHTMLVMERTDLVGDKLNVEIASGSMPRRQPKWESAAQSKYRFTIPKAGGAGVSDDGYAFTALGGGLKRWRHAKAIDGRYYNVVSGKDHSVFIANSDSIRLAARVDAFEELLGDLPPLEKRDLLLTMIEEERAHLAKYPASCSARIRREKAFEELYAHQAEHFGQSQSQVDQAYRVFEDFVFAELVYDQSRTCCWNSSNGAMYQAIVAYAEEMVESDDQCTPPPVFKMVDGAYDAFEVYAEEMGVFWPEWSADEACPQSEFYDTDTEAEGNLSFCSLEWNSAAGEGDGGPDAGCFVQGNEGCNGCACESCVCEADPFCCGTSWDSYCVKKCAEDCGGNCPVTD